MPFSSINFSNAKVLETMYEKNLLESYDYEISTNNTLFSKISSHFTITKVEKINNPLLYGMYSLWKEELQNNLGWVNTNTLYHATSPTNAQRIAGENIDWRRTSRSRFGKGAYFSPCPDYAHKHASSSGAFVIFDVLTKRIQCNVGVNYELNIPTEQCDTTLSSNRKVIVKYDDYQFYPKFIVYYSTIIRTRSQSRVASRRNTYIRTIDLWDANSDVLKRWLNRSESEFKEEFSRTFDRDFVHQNGKNNS